MINDQFPLSIQADDISTNLETTREWIFKNRAELLAKLSIHGALLLRGFPVASAEDCGTQCGGLRDPVRVFDLGNQCSCAVAGCGQRVARAGSTVSNGQLVFCADHHSESDKGVS